MPAQLSSPAAAAPTAAPSEPGPNGRPWPGVSVVMPILNEERHLSDAVAMALTQDYPGPLEVVLAVGPSRDRTQQIADQLAAADPRVRPVPNPSGRTPDGLNAAVAHARHDIIARVDGHAEISPGYLRLAVAEMARVGADNVGGVMDAQGVTDFEKAVACAMRSRIGVGNAAFHVGGDAGEADTVYLGVFRRAALERVGGYDPHFARAQDWELNHRIRQTGGRVWFTPQLRVTYRPRASVSALARQYLHYGRWRRVVAARHGGTINARYLAPPAMVCVTTAGALAGLRWRRAWLAPAAYLVGVVAGGLAISRGESAATRAATPAVLATMHWAWGLGFLTSPRALRADALAARGALRSQPGRRGGRHATPRS